MGKSNRNVLLLFLSDAKTIDLVMEELPLSQCEKHRIVFPWMTNPDFDLSAMLKTEAKKFKNTMQRKFKSNPKTDKLLGEGGFAKVYISTLDKKNVAVKYFTAVPTTVQDAKEVFLSNTLKHKNIMSSLCFFDLRLGKRNCNLISVFDVMDQKCLRTFLDDGHGGQKSLPIKKLAFVCLAICNGLNYLHTNGIMHRDIKPENILLHSDNSVKISDLGLAMDSKNDERDTEFVGTLPYTPPEQIINGDYNEKVDIWAFGILFCELLSGFAYAPFTEDVSNEVLQVIITEFNFPTQSNLELISEDRSESFRLNDCENELAKVCLSRKPECRPSAAHILSFFQQLESEPLFE